MNLRNVSAIFTIGLCLCRVGAGTPDILNCLNLFATSSRLEAIIYGGGQFVAVGFYGAIVTSPDGTNWVARESATTDDLNSIAYGNGRFVAVGDLCGDVRCFGTIVSSMDGANWVAREVPEGVWGLGGVTYGNGVFVAGSGNGNVLVSTNAENWVLYPVLGQNGFRTLTFAAGKFVAVTGDGQSLTSTDGIHWSNGGFMAGGEIGAIAYGGGQFVAADFNAILASTNGVDWHTVWTPPDDKRYQLIGIGYGNGVWVATAYGEDIATRRGGATLLTSTDTLNWTDRDPKIPASRFSSFLTDVTFANGQFVAVGDRGAIVLSTDGTNWSSLQPGSSNLASPLQPDPGFVAAGNSPLDHWTPTYSLESARALRFVAYGNGQFVALGDGFIETSSNGTMWTSHDVRLPEGVNGLTFGNGVLLAVSAGGTAHVSSNGVDWVTTKTASPNLYGVGFGRGIFVAVGANGMVLTSTDGMDWIGQDSGTTMELDAVAYGNDQFVIVGPSISITSPDGENWTSHGTSAYTYRLAFGNGRFVAAHFYDKAVTSADGFSWVPASVRLEAIAFANGLFLGAEQNGGIVTSPDGVTWTRPSVDAPLTRGFAYGSGQYVAVQSSGSIFSSANAGSWTLRQPAKPAVFSGIGYGNGQYVAVGESGLILTSTNAVGWTRRESGTQSALSEVAYGNGRFVVPGGRICAGCTAGQSIIFTSEDAVVWTPRRLETNFLFGRIAFGNGQFVAAGWFYSETSSSPAIVTSSDGVNWIPRYKSPQNWFSSVTFGEGGFVAVGQGAVRATSPDGLNWTICGLPAETSLNDVAYGNGKYVAVGGRRLGFDSPDSESAIVSLIDGKWRLEQSPTTNVFYAIAYGDGQWVAAGSGRLITSADGATWRLLKSDRDSIAYSPRIVYGNREFVAVSDRQILVSGKAGLPAGPLGLWIDAAFTNAAPGFPVSFNAWHSSPVREIRWDFDDGIILTNQYATTHAWSNTGIYNVRLTAYTANYPSGESVMLPVSVTRSTYYVNASSSKPVPPYSSWATAASDIQNAIEAGEGPGRLVLVTNGVYRSGTTATPNGLTRVSLTNAVLVQSVNGPSVTSIEGAAGGVRCAYVINGSVLSGFTLTNGSAAGEWPAGTGGGVFGDNSAVITNCVLVSNSAEQHGGAVMGSVLYRCRLTGNSSQYNGAGAFQSTLYNCVLENNSSHNNGGGADGSILYSCKLTGNHALGEGGWGGGASFSTLYNCILTGNSAGQYGGGALAGTLYNCTVIGNSADGAGGGVYGDQNFPITIYNSIVLSNNGDNYSGGSFLFSCASPLPDGDGNLDADPLFANSGAQDFHLRFGSPCIDSGTNLVALITSDFDAGARPLDGNGDGTTAFDMGAYEADFSSALPRFVSVRRAAAELIVEWNGVAKGMKLQRAVALSNPVWQDVSGSQGVTAMTLPLGRGTEFFRLHR